MFEILRIAATSPGPASVWPARLEEFRAYRYELEERGFDVEALLRDGARAQIATAILFSTVFPSVSTLAVGADLSDEHRESVGPPIGWTDALALGQALDLDQLRDMLQSQAGSTALTQIAAWVAGAPIEDVVIWRPPSRAEFLSFGVADPLPMGVHRWVLDRFTMTYPQDWAPSSLRLEWRYIHGGVTAPCLPRYMGDRRVHEDDLAKLIADQASVAEPPAKMRFSGELSASRYVPVAVAMLREGRQAAAAAIFEAMVALAPTNAAAMNNWAFCMMPSDPDRALEILERAARSGYGQFRLSVANRLRCLVGTGRITAALDLAETTIRDWHLLAGEEGVLWTKDCDLKEAQVFDCEDIGAYILDLIEEAAAAQDDEAVRLRWDATLRDLRR
ncbi:MAG TPA: hypothetical protein VHD81_06000 [Mycobacteriales bacterium]|nr:hypothetical protein [Mycobacteriales bacterium]